MVWKTAKWGMISLIVALTIVLAGVVGFAVGDDNDSPGVTVNSQSNSFEILDEIYQILGDDFVNPEAVDLDLLRAGAINGIIEALGDPHTVYITPDDYELGVDIFSGTFEGIGARVERDPVSGDIVILTPFRDSPAEKRSGSPVTGSPRRDIAPAASATSAARG